MARRLLAQELVGSAQVAQRGPFAPPVADLAVIARILLVVLDGAAALAQVW